MRETRLRPCVAATLFVLAVQCQASSSRVSSLAIETVRGVTTGGCVNPLSVVVVKGAGRIFVNSAYVDRNKKVSICSACSYAAMVSGHDLSEYDIQIEYEDKYVGQLGGSDGAAIATGVVAALTNRPVRQDVAITGDVSQLGHVGGVGAIQEKVTAAYAAGMNAVIIPAANAGQVPEMSVDTLMRFQVVAASDMRQVLAHALSGISGEVVHARSMALGLYKAQDWEKAVACLEKLVQLCPEDLSLDLISRSARKEWRSLQARTQRIDGMIALAGTMEAAGTVGQAIDIYEQAYQLLVKAADVQKSLSLADLERKRQVCLEKAMTTAADCMHNGRPGDALSLYIVILKIAPDLSWARQVARQIDAGEFADAEKALGEAAAMLPGNRELKDVSLALQVARGLAEAKSLLKDARVALGRGDLRACVTATHEAMKTASGNAEIAEAAKELLEATSRQAGQRADALFAKRAYSEASEYYGLAAAGASEEPRASFLSRIEACRRLPEVLRAAETAAGSSDVRDHIALVQLIAESGYHRDALSVLQEGPRSDLCALTAMRILLLCGRVDDGRVEYLRFAKGSGADTGNAALSSVRQLVLAVPRPKWQPNEIAKAFYLAVAECRASGGSPEAHMVAAILGAMSGETQLAQWHLDELGESHRQLPQHLISAAKIVLCLKTGETHSTAELAKSVLDYDCGPAAMCFAACAVEADKGLGAGHAYIEKVARMWPWYRPLLSSVTNVDPLFPVLFPMAVSEWFPKCTEMVSDESTQQMASSIGELLSR